MTDPRSRIKAIQDEFQRRLAETLDGRLVERIGIEIGKESAPSILAEEVAGLIGDAMGDRLGLPAEQLNLMLPEHLSLEEMPPEEFAMSVVLDLPRPSERKAQHKTMIELRSFLSDEPIIIFPLKDTKETELFAGYRPGSAKSELRHLSETLRWAAIDLEKIVAIEKGFQEFSATRKYRQPIEPPEKVLHNYLTTLGTAIDALYHFIGKHYGFADVFDPRRNIPELLKKQGKEPLAKLLKERFYSDPIMKQYSDLLRNPVAHAKPLHRLNVWSCMSEGRPAELGLSEGAQRTRYTLVEYLTSLYAHVSKSVSDVLAQVFEPHERVAETVTGIPRTFEWFCRSDGLACIRPEPTPGAAKDAYRRVTSRIPEELALLCHLFA